MVVAMEFPPEVWRRIRDYVFDYRRYWARVSAPCLAQLSALDDSLLWAGPMADGVFRVTRARRSWWDVPSARICGHSIEIHDGFAYRHGVVYFPKGANGSVIPPKAITAISLSEGEPEEAGPHV